MWPKRPFGGKQCDTGEGQSNTQGGSNIIDRGEAITYMVESLPEKNKMSQQIDTAIVFDTATIADTWCAYEHLAQFEAGMPPEVVFVNACPLVDVYRMTEGRRNSEWLRIFQKGGSVMVRIIYQSSSKLDAMRHAMEHAKSLRYVPRCNLHGVNITGVPRRLVCSNGQTYDTQKHAADSLALQPAAISRHMRGALRQVGGYTFKYEE